MNKENEYWQCSHTRKCKWIGEYEDLESIKNTEHPEIDMLDSVCPKCGNPEFYILNEEEYHKIIKRRKRVFSIDV